MKRTRKLEEMRPSQGQQPPQCWSRRNFSARPRCLGNPNPQDGEETKAVHPPAENAPAPRAERGRAEYAPASGLFHHPVQSPDKKKRAWNSRKGK